MSKVLRTGARLYFAPRSAMGFALAAVLGLAAMLLVIQFLAVFVRRLGA